MVKSEEWMATKTQRRYRDECKADAVRLGRDSARPVAQVARDVGIADHLQPRWRVEQRQTESQGHTCESMHKDQKVLVRLRR
ncbi:MAG: transposase [Nitrospiraceae bacterium]